MGDVAGWSSVEIKSIKCNFVFIHSHLPYKIQFQFSKHWNSEILLIYDWFVLPSICYIFVLIEPYNNGHVAINIYLATGTVQGV